MNTPPEVVADLLLGQTDRPSKPPRAITIYCVGSNNYTVQEGEALCDRLCWDEMLGTIAELTHPRIGSARYRMQTAEERAAYEEARDRRLAEIRAEEEARDKSMLDTLRRWCAAEKADDASEFANARAERDRILAGVAR